MGLDKELANMRRRLNKIVPQIQPPELKMTVIGASEAVPAHTSWEMIVRVEDKHPSFNR
tara:strand:+ start:601 stop:777 length:177 start_codon:yes stop_codon:yes gene_type:complete